MTDTSKTSPYSHHETHFYLLVLSPKTAYILKYSHRFITCGWSDYVLLLTYRLTDHYIIKSQQSSYHFYSDKKQQVSPKCRRICLFLDIVLRPVDDAMDRDHLINLKCLYRNQICL